ncbi:MAG: hypothetical protein AAGC74_01775 [Verrucomicrobiota bacterium]
MALEKMEGVTAAFVNNDIVLCLASDDFDEKAVAAAVEPHKIQFVSAKKAAELPY